jgi:hypothetical protein
MRPKLGMASLAALLVTWSCARDDSEAPRVELSGEVGAGGFGGVPIATSVGPGGEGGAGGSGGAGGGGCSDAHEPNDDEPSATDLGMIDDCNPTGLSVDGKVGPGELDWYRFAGDDSGACVVDPARVLTADGPVRLCKFAECTNGAATVTCQDGSTAATSPDAREGCCHDTGFSMDVDCPGMDDDAAIYLRVDQAAACVTYSLTVHY